MLCHVCLRGLSGLCHMFEGFECAVSLCLRGLSVLCHCVFEGFECAVSLCV